ncbi:MAG: glycosyltransferase family 2 protein [Deltaproteobacteria bacterium]|nr:glycosyltransferase family 2 protein [Deltaproteobacteria bacterium]
MPSLAAAIITKNEAENLPRWLAAVAPAVDEVVAVDSGSTDATVELLRAAGARVAHRDWSGYAAQRNHCADLCQADWVLFLDGDEFIDQELAQALLAFRAGPEPGEAGFELAYKVFFFGHFLRHGGFFPEYHLRLYHRARGRWEKREVHERVVVDGPVGRLAGYVHHHSYRTVGEYLRRSERYSAEAARQLAAAGRRAGAWTVAGHGAWAFANRFLLRGGFLDGYAGYLAAKLESHYTFSKYARLREINQKEGTPQ